MITSIEIVNLIINTCCATVHTVGIGLLVAVGKRTVLLDNQRTLVLNLSICDLLQCLVQVLHDLCKIFDDNAEVHHSIRAAQFTLLASTFYSIMFAILFDKFAHVQLNIRYPVVVSEARLRCGAAAAWLVPSIACTPFIALHILNDWEPILPIFIAYIVIDIAYLVAFVAIYAFIFRKFVTSKVPPTAAKSRSEKQKFSSRAVLRESHFNFYRSSFFVATLIIANFVALMILPNVVCLALQLHHRRVTYDIDGYVLICYQLSWLCDGLIYILFEPRMRRCLCKRVMKLVHRQGATCGRNSVEYKHSNSS